MPNDFDLGSIIVSFLLTTNRKDEMRECLKVLMLQYIKENPSVEDVVVPIFSDAELLIRNQSERALIKTMKKNHVNAEDGVLNILQNVAMIGIEEKSAHDFLFSEILEEGDAAYKLYNDVNDIKLQKGYISTKQHEANALIATKLSLRPPLGRW